MKKPLACPFCKSNDIRIDGLMPSYYPYCTDCLAIGPANSDRFEAWDKRPTKDELREEIKELRAALENSHLGELIYRVKAKIMRVVHWAKNHECL